MPIVENETKYQDDDTHSAVSNRYPVYFLSVGSPSALKNDAPRYCQYIRYFAYKDADTCRRNRKLYTHLNTCQHQHPYPNFTDFYQHTFTLSSLPLGYGFART
jgi:hypothetical protein